MTYEEWLAQRASRSRLRNWADEMAARTIWAIAKIWH